MKNNLFSESCLNELIFRIESLEKDVIPKWGKMSASQMFAHCSQVLKNALGETQQKRKFIGYFVAPFIRHRFYNDIPYKKKGGPSTFGIKGDKDFIFE